MCPALSSRPVPIPSTSGPQTAAAAVLCELAAAGVTTVFGIPGGPLLPIYEALGDAGDALATVLVRHEAAAVFAADGYARCHDGLAAAALTAGPGSTNAVSALAVALRDMVPVFVLAATPPLSVIGKSAAQELDTLAIVQHVTKEAMVLTSPGRARELTRRLLHVALNGRPGPVALLLPADVARSPVPAPLTGHAPILRLDPRPCDDTAVRKAARALATAAHPAMLVGSGAVSSGAAPAVVRLAELLGCPVASTPRAKGVFPESHPLSVGPFGFSGSPVADRAIGDDSDVLLCIGTRLGELSTGSWTPRLRGKRLIQVDLVPEEIGRNYDVHVGIVGDARAVCEALARALRSQLAGRTAPPAPADQPLWLDAAETASGAHPAAEDPDRSSIPPERVMATLRQELSQDTVIFCDIGNTMCWAIRLLVRERPRTFHVNLTYGCMGHAVPAAIGAQMRLTAPVVALVGDAAFAMTGAEINVAAGAGLPGPVFVVLDNGGHGMCDAGFRIACEGRAPSCWFEQPSDVAALARAHGVNATVVERAAELGPVLRRALDARKPAVLHVRIDREAAPPMGSRLAALSFVPPGERP